MNEIFDIIKDSNSILLLAHENPDGDAIGSLMGCYHMLKDMNKSVDCVIPEIPDTFLFGVYEFWTNFRGYSWGNKMVK